MAAYIYLRPEPFDILFSHLWYWLRQVPAFSFGHVASKKYSPEVLAGERALAQLFLCYRYVVKHILTYAPLEQMNAAHLVLGVGGVGKFSNRKGFGFSLCALKHAWLCGA